VWRQLTPPNPSDPRFGYTPLPAWVEGFRATQWDKIEEVNEAFKENDVVFLQAPTGTGKSLIGEVGRRLLRTSGVYCCTTKNLQDQFATDFPYAKVVKGRANYLTQSGKLDAFGNKSTARWSEITCADCTYNPKTEECRWCSDRNSCPYQLAKTKAMLSELAVLNTSYFLTSSNKGGGEFRNRGLVVLDEADMLEGELLNHVEVDISPSRMDKLGLEPPKIKSEGAKSNDWQEWVDKAAIPRTFDYFNGLPTPYEHDLGAADIREWQGINNLLDKLKDLSSELPAGGWVYDGWDREHVIFRPTRIDRYGKGLLWGHGRKYLLMSATILSADLMAEELGLTRPYTLVDVESGFDKANRPIFVVPVADMAFRERRTSWPLMVDGVKGVLRNHPNERVLVHAVSYEFADYLYKALRGISGDRNIVSYSTSVGKQYAIKEYKSSPNSVLIAASMDRGVDLPDDLCRVQVVAKIPFPNIKDKRVNGRMYSAGGHAWYAMQTVRTLIQMCGRGVRSEDDYATTYILDSQFVTNLWKKSWLFPEWWKEAVRWDYPKRRLVR
jgi:ATP-dependent DNA helicase DinG